MKRKPTQPSGVTKFLPATVLEHVSGGTAGLTNAWEPDSPKLGPLIDPKG